MNKAADIITSMNNLRDVICFIERLSTRLYGQTEVEDVYKVLKNEFAKSKKYSMSIVLLSVSGTRLKVKTTSRAALLLEKAEKVAGLKFEGFTIDPDKSETYKKVVRGGETVHAQVSCIMKEFLPSPLAGLISKILRYERKFTIITPLFFKKKIIGAFAMSSPELVQYFIPSVKILVQHISQALEIAEKETIEHQLEKKITEIENQERLRIGQDLHDSLGQHLTGLALKCKALEQKNAGRIPLKTQDFAEIIFLVNQSIEQVHQLAKGLFPVKMENNGISMALKELAEHTQHLFGISCVFRCDLATPIVNNIAFIHLYRIAQEAITNAIKHGQAKHISLSISNFKQHIKLIIEDDGTGILSNVDWEKGLGLKIMQYRANIIGGSLEIRRSGNKGTVVSCVIPADA